LKVTWHSTMLAEGAIKLAHEGKAFHEALYVWRA